MTISAEGEIVSDSFGRAENLSWVPNGDRCKMVPNGISSVSRMPSVEMFAVAQEMMMFREPKILGEAKS